MFDPYASVFAGGSAGKHPAAFCRPTISSSCEAAGLRPAASGPDKGAGRSTERPIRLSIHGRYEIGSLASSVAASVIVTKQPGATAAWSAGYNMRKGNESNELSGDMARRIKVLSVFGTRPEAIKMAPLVARLSHDASIDTRVCVTAQHRALLDQVLELFAITPDFDLDVMRVGQDLAQLGAALLQALASSLGQIKPDLVLVHGDTTTTLAAALAAFYQHIPVGHVEAGLRSGDINAPWPEEANRRLVTVITNLHFAPTESARRNLLREGVASSAIVVTGNTVVDALLMANARIEDDPAVAERLARQFSFLRGGTNLVLITGHRRENLGDGLEGACRAIRSLAGEFPAVDFVYTMHLNPRVREPVLRLLSGVSNVHLREPLDYLAFVYLMGRSHLILTDSGGIQEEAPALGKPVLVMRDRTERPEAVEAGTVKLVGTQPERIVEAVRTLISDRVEYERMSRAHNPYGDGKASDRIVAAIKASMGMAGGCAP